jgi:hypothetical protein
MKEEYRFLLTGTQKIWLRNQLHRLEGFWLNLANEVIGRGKYSEIERYQLNELGRLVKTKKNTIDNKII